MTITADQIPDEVVEIVAGQFARSEHSMPLHCLPDIAQVRLRNNARVAIAAALNAWPGMTISWAGFPEHYKGGEFRASLPLQENP